MTAIAREGTFRGVPTEWAVTETTNGFPQLVIRISALEYFDEDGRTGAALGIADSAGKWISWAQYQRDLVGYFVLVTEKGSTLNAQQAQAALGWDGLDFATLQNGEYGNTMVLFRTENRMYQGQTRLQMTWLDSYDASPIRQLTKLDDNKFAAMQAKWQGQLSQAAVPPTPATPGAPELVVPVPGSLVMAPALPVAAAPAVPQAVQAAPGSPASVVQTQAAPAVPQATAPQPQPAPAADAPAAEPKKRGRGRPRGSTKAKAQQRSAPPVADPQPTTAEAAAPAPTAAPAATPPPAAVPQQTQASVPCSKEEAWDNILETIPANYDQEKLSDIWLAVVRKHAPDSGDDSVLTPEQWGQVRDGVAAIVASGGDDIPF